MTNRQQVEAELKLDQRGRYLDANDAALELLGVSLAELRTSTADRFAIRPTTDSEQAALRSQWETGGAPPLVGTAGLRRADGTAIRVSYAIEAEESGFRARMQPIDGPPEAPPSIFVVGDVLREWRAAERVLAELARDTAEWKRAVGEVEMLRRQYQQLFEAAESRTRGTSD